jgi:DNA-binding XRE family transcriptional regulator
MVWLTSTCYPTGMKLDSEKIPTGRMIRAARGLLNLDQVQLGALVGVTRRTIMRIEGDDPQPTNPRRIKVCAAIRDVLEEGSESEKRPPIRFIYADKSTGEGVVMRKGK